MYENYSVLIHDVVKSYGNNQILKKLCMKVEKGKIYGLLGSSGCGKTTLLSAIVGRKRVESGEIWVLGGKPGERGSGIPGPKVGYMPQDIALVGEFTVKDAIYYFGRIFRMNEKRIEERYNELVELLDLPPENRMLKNCSGGQQRRISFAVALVHSPKLLILDEPTVGIDPLLREKIWSHLVEITNKEKLSVIITTHYIEECRQADKIGLMREGRLLTEDSPNNLLIMYNTQTLEEVFYILSQQQEDGKLPFTNQNSSDSNRLEKVESIGLSTSTLSSMQSIPEEYKSTDVITKKPTVQFDIINKKRMLALLNKNFKQFYRNETAIMFLLLMPILQIVLLVYSLGLDMKNIPIGIVNDEGMSAYCPSFSLNETIELDDGILGCHFHNLSCRFLKHHLSHSMIHKIEYHSIEEATEDVKHGTVSGVMYIPKNFSTSFEHKLEYGLNSSPEILEFSQIKVMLDMSNQQIGVSVKNKLIDLYMQFQKSVFSDCKFVEGFGSIPIKIEYVHGSIDEAYQVFVLPGNIVTMLFFFGSIMTSHIMIMEKQEGIWDRSIVAGVTSLELIVSHLTFQGFIVIFQSLEMIILTYCIYQFEYVGSLWLMFMIAYLQGICGMSFGLFVSVICSSIFISNNAIMGFYLPMLIISGVLWPLQGMPEELQLLAKILPAALPVISLNKVVKKGFSIDNLEVLGGFCISITWMIIFVLLSLFVMKIKR